MEETKVSEPYKKGFNHAYTLGKQMPEVLKGMQVPASEPGDYTQGFSDGKKQFEKDKEHGRIPSDKSRSQDKDHDIGNR